jgi:hypothetical protein
MSGDTKDATIKRLNDLASRVETLEFLLQSNDITVPSMAGTDNNGEMYPPTQDPDTTFNFPGYNSQSKDGQLQQQLQQIQDLADYLQSLIAQQQLIGTGGSADFNQAGAMDAFQGTADDAANGNGKALPASIISALTPTPVVGITCYNNALSVATGAAFTTATFTGTGAFFTRPNFSTNPSAFTGSVFGAPINGYYYIGVQAFIVPCECEILATVNGAIVCDGSATGSAFAAAPTASGIFSLLAGDKVSLLIRQNSGGTLSASVRLSVYLLAKS